jgi:Mor family transcriptional regulator
VRLERRLLDTLPLFGLPGEIPCRHALSPAGNKRTSGKRNDQHRQVYEAATASGEEGAGMVRKDYNRDGEIHYPDRGCVKAKMKGYDGKCLDCPFPQCLEDGDVPSTYQETITARNKEIRQLYETGWTVAEIAKQYSLSVRHTERIIAESPTEIIKHSKSSGVKWKRKHLAERNIEIRRLKKAGMPVDEIAGKYKICAATVWAVCRDK